MNTTETRWTIRTLDGELSLKQRHEIAEAMYYVMTGDPYLTEENGPIIGRIVGWLRAQEWTDGATVTTRGLVLQWIDRQEATR